MEPELKRLFFGLEAHAPWPENLPDGRLLDENHRHLTLAFLGDVDCIPLKAALKTFPIPSFKVGFVGQFDQCLFLPPRHPRVVAWHVDFLEENSPLIAYSGILKTWLKESGFSPDERHDFNPHITLARAPFNENVWKKTFSPIPLFLKDIHLYESTGKLHYEPIWTFPLLAPFDEISHTADVAYHVRGENEDQLYRHAEIAMASTFPEILPFLKKRSGMHNLDDVIIALNELVAEVDQAIGCPFKAISFHSHLEEKDHILHWEMIVDV